MSRKNLFEMIQNASKDNHDYASEFLTELDYHIRKLEKYSQRQVSKTFKPSSIKCPRCAVMQVLGAEQNKETRSSSMIGITTSGSFIHEMMQSKILTMSNWEYVNVVDYIKNNDDLVVIKACNFKEGIYETKLHSNKWNMNFLVDGILRKGNKYMLLEIKSIGSSGFFKTKEVPEKYKDQAISYCNLVGLDDVLFLFVDRDLFNMKTFLYTPSEKDKLKWVDTMLKNIEYVNKGVIPKKPTYADRVFCQYCSYSDYCNEIGSEEYEFSKELRESM